MTDTPHTDAAQAADRRLNQDAAGALRHIVHESHGFLSPEQVGILAVASTTRLAPLLVRMGSGRFTAPAQDVPRLLALIKGSGTTEYVRDVSLLAGHDYAGYLGHPTHKLVLTHHCQAAGLGVKQWTIESSGGGPFKDGAEFGCLGDVVVAMAREYGYSLGDLVDFWHKLDKKEASTGG